MNKVAMTTAALFVAMTTGAFAEKWSVTEQAASGIKYASGTWTLATEGEKVSGKAEMMKDNGTPVNYALDGTKSGGVYTIKMVNRDDGKANCVYTGKATEGARVYNGDVVCDGGQKFTVRGGVQ